MQIKTAMRCYLIPIPRRQKSLSLTLACLGESGGQEEAFHTADGSVKWIDHFGKNLARAHTAKNPHYPQRTRRDAPEEISQRVERDACMDVHCNTEKKT